MASAKRISIATVLGLIFGFVCFLLARPMAPEGGIPTVGIWTIVLEMGVLGFAIGISAWRLAWWLHGILMGLIFSVPGAFGAVWTGFGWSGFVWSLGMGAVFGFLIELITAVAFKARAVETPQVA